MNEKAVIDIRSGESFIPGLIDGKGRLYLHSQLTKAGVPDKRARGYRLAYWDQFNPAWEPRMSGYHAILDPSREPEAALLRAKVDALEAQLEAAKEALFVHYAGPKPAVIPEPESEKIV